ncbi:YEATS-associated helix-containing protein [Azonexus hydrophilus]
MSNDLQSTFQISMPSSGLDGHMLLILAIMVLAGILGGAANYFLAERQGEAGGVTGSSTRSSAWWRRLPYPCSST